MTLHSSRRGNRGAYTLMELLIVIIIMIILVAITLPIAKKTMEDSGPREASRQLSAFFELAKAKAASTGRPWGIWIQCDQPLGAAPVATGVPSPVRQATKFYLAESPELYAGDYLDSRVRVDMSATTTGPWPLLWGQSGGTFSASNYVPVGTLYSLLTGLNPTLPAQTRTEFFIRFNYAGPWFRGYVGPNLQALTGATGLPYAFYIYGKAGRDQVLPNGQLYSLPAWGTAGVDDDGDGSIDEADASEYLAAGSDDIRPPFPTTGPNGVPFQIVRQPQRVNNTVELSSGACVDLVYSGVGLSGVDFSGYDAGFNSNNPLSYYSTIIVMFLPGGGIDSIYLQPPPIPGATSVPGTIYGQINATGNLHFLIGKVQKVNIPAPYSSNPTGIGSSTDFGANMFDPDASNLVDASCFWLSIGRFNGAITTNENAPPSLVTAAPPNLTYRYVDPTGNTQQQVLSALTPLSRSAFVGYCRTIAAGQQQMGGR